MTMMLLDIMEPGQEQPHEQVKATVGIDLGTTHSLVAISNGGYHEIIGARDGQGLMPSVVAYDASEVLVGEKARGAGDAFTSIKRLMGRAYADVSEQEKQQYAIMSSENDAVIALRAGEKTVSAVEISAQILGELKKRAERELENEVGYAVITVPAYFDDAARQATKDAAKLAGMEVLRLVNEPTAAALAYGLDHEAEGMYAVYDLGGGTFDVSILKMEGGVFQVLATGGDIALGGDDFDELLLRYALDESGLSIEDESDYALLKAAARQAKEQLTEEDTAEISCHLRGGELSVNVSRETFNTLSKPLIDKTLYIFSHVIEDAATELSELKQIIVVGGSTRMQIVREALEAFAGKAPFSALDPDQVVAIGAAVQAESLSKGTGALLLDVNPLSLGIETYGGLVETIIHRNTPIPTVASQTFTTYQDGQTGMSIHVVQGEREMVDVCRSLARFELKDIPPMVAGAAHIEISFMLDADGLLTVSAREETTGVEQSVEVKPSYGFSDEQMEKMLLDSMENAQQDITRRLLAESKIEAQLTVDAVQKALNEDGNLLDKDYYNAITAQITMLKASMDDDNRDAIDAHNQALDKITAKFAEIRVNKALGESFAGRDVNEVSRSLASDSQE